ncbi:hypothetical protein [Pedobacter gandavensis]|uniref:hypothetical protein n=1 Tax=Pedobacter gandavensis TaxID=2679963 RepID=UPI00292FD38B|nr:hypothetical protein [Pedobacter gandavensis]
MGRKIIEKMICLKAAFFVLAMVCLTNVVFSQVNYSERIKKVAEISEDMTYIYTPMGVKEFEVLWKQPELYLDSAIQYLRRPSYEELEFSVVSLSMCELKTEKYLIFLESCFESYYDRKINDDIMGLVLGGVFGNPYIRDNSTDGRVQVLLKKLIENKKTSRSIKNRAIDYRNGKVPKSYEGPNPMFRSKKEMDDWEKLNKS